MPIKTCLVCNKSMSLSNNPNGLVFQDEFFVCSECCMKHSEEEIKDISKTVMHRIETGMPIALWLIHEQNKDKTMMTIMR